MIIVLMFLGTIAAIVSFALWWIFSIIPPELNDLRWILGLFIVGVVIFILCILGGEIKYERQFWVKKDKDGR